MHDDILVQIIKKDHVIFTCYGLEDYRLVSSNILQLIKRKKIIGIHDFSPNVNVTLVYDGSVLMAVDYDFYEMPMDDANGEKSLESSGYVVIRWVPVVKNSLNLHDWKIISYDVYVAKTSHYFSITRDEMR